MSLGLPVSESLGARVSSGESDASGSSRPFTPSGGPDYPHVLDEVFSTNYDSLARQHRLLSAMYDLPTYTFELSTPNRAFFDYVTTVQYFVVLVVYSDTRRVFLFTSTDGGKEQYYLPARAINSEASIEDTVRKLSSEVLPGCELTGFEPVALLSHLFVLDQAQPVEVWPMTGVAYSARLLDLPEVPPKGQSWRNGLFIPFSEARRLLSDGLVTKYSNASVLARALDHLDQFFQLRVRHPDSEVRTNRAVLARYRLHDVIVKPLLGVIKRAQRFREAILQSIGKPCSFLDASCGDSSIVLSVAQGGAEVCVGNDISWSQIQLLLARFPQKQRHGVVFTNHNLVSLPFRDQFFDVVLCKNTLHHLGTPSEFRLALTGLTRVAKKVVIVEVEDPSRAWLPKLINRYYRRFLRDVGEHFFSAAQFKEAIEETLKGKGEFSFDWKTFSSLHANYLFAIITRAD